MHVSWSVDGDEARDVLNRSWGEFMAQNLPEAVWVPIPNLGMAGAARFLDDLELSGVIFTGDGNLGQDALRDETELGILDAVIKRKLPALCVNRGFMLMQTRFKGGLEPRAGHMRLKHKILLSNLPFYKHPHREVMVNSLHQAGIIKLGQGLVPFAVDSKGGVEGAYHEQHRLVGVMWNPERPGSVAEFDGGLVRALFDQPG